MEKDNEELEKIENQIDKEDTKQEIDEVLNNEKLEQNIEIKNEENIQTIKEEKVDEVKNEEENKEKDTKEKIEEEKNIEENIKEEKLETEEKDNKKTKNKNIKISIIISAIIIFILFLSTIFAILNINNENIAKGVYIENFNISNFNKEELNNSVNGKIQSIEDIEIKYEDYNEVIKLEEIGIEINAKDAIINSINIGKTNNIIVDNYNILKARIFKTKFKLDIKTDDNKFNEMIKNIQVEIPGAVEQYTYEIKEDELIITNGKAGKSINLEQLKKDILENIKEQFNGNKNTLQIKMQDEEPDKIDIEKIYKEIYKEEKDAYIVEEPFELHKEESGVDFDISIEEAKEILKENKETYTIPLKITKPKVEVKDLGDKLFKQTLSKYTTIYDSSNTNRANNIAIAAKTINGTILLPGETFSYNGKIGNTTQEKGYKLGGAYVGDKIVQAYGGGVCQVSTTLYNAVLYANLDIVQRYNHSYAVSYVPASRDATVSYCGKDFKFKNTRTYPIKIEANAKNGVVSVSIQGIKEEKEYEVVLTSNVLSTTPCSVVYENNSALAEGKQKVIQKGHGGYKSIAYKIVKYNGKTISKTVLSKDTYKPMNKIIQVGTTKEVTEQTTEVPQEVQTDTNIQ